MLALSKLKRHVKKEGIIKPMENWGGEVTRVC